ncbi:MAG: pyrroline-5-carboxylate reductase [Gammaproteobacteria bacterium]|nr:pyrroline-5-carboxylate reductase [Gammaproteobacteria bacterium]
MTNTHYPSILMVGAGNMGSSIAAGLIARNWPANQVTFCDLDSDRHRFLKEKFPDSHIISDPSELTSTPKVVLLAVKPDDMSSLCQQLSTANLPTNTLFISIAAGVPINAFQNWLGAKASIVRCMPNTPAAIGLGMTGLYCSQKIAPPDRELADQILSSIGKTLWVDKECMLDAVTALSGSGPAYLFYFMECLQESGMSLGLNSQDSYLLTLQTMLGAAQLAQQQDIEFKTLRANVTSKGGTTEKAINCFIDKDMKNTVDSALKAAAERAGEISQTFNKE